MSPSAVPPSPQMHQQQRSYDRCSTLLYSTPGGHDPAVVCTNVSKNTANTATQETRPYRDKRTRCTATNPRRTYVPPANGVSGGPRMYARHCRISSSSADILMSSSGGEVCSLCISFRNRFAHVRDMPQTQRV